MILIDAPQNYFDVYNSSVLQLIRLLEKANLKVRIRVQFNVLISVASDFGVMNMSFSPMFITDDGNVFFKISSIGNAFVQLDTTVLSTLLERNSVSSVGAWSIDNNLGIDEVILSSSFNLNTTTPNSLRTIIQFHIEEMTVLASLHWNKLEREEYIPFLCLPSIFISTTHKSRHPESPGQHFDTTRIVIISPVLLDCELFVISIMNPQMDNQLPPKHMQLMPKFFSLKESREGNTIFLLQGHDSIDYNHTEYKCEVTARYDIKEFKLNMKSRDLTIRYLP